MGRPRSKVCPLRFLAPLAGPEAGPCPARAWFIAMRSIQTDRRPPDGLLLPQAHKQQFEEPALQAKGSPETQCARLPQGCDGSSHQVRAGLTALSAAA